MSNRRLVLKNNQIQEASENDEFDYELDDSFLSTHGSLVPMQSAVQGPRVFYGARFFNQALPVKNPESPWVQSLDSLSGKSFESEMGDLSGNVRAVGNGTIGEVGDDFIRFIDSETGEEKNLEFYQSFPFNRKTGISNYPLVKPGQKVKKGDLLARSNYTSEDGSLSMGLNTRIGLVPYLGYSMDDATVISESMAKRLTSEHNIEESIEYKNGVKGGRDHFASLFPKKFPLEQLEQLDDEGVVRQGSIVQPGDPLILATRPRMLSSLSGNLGSLSRKASQMQSDASTVWDQSEPGEVVDVTRTKHGVKMHVKTYLPAQRGDKVVLRTGQKGVLAEILPDEHMPRTQDGRPLEMLLNPLGIPSRANSSLVYELLLGKAAEKAGKPMIMPSYPKAGEKWYDLVQNALDEVELTDVEQIYDPKHDRFLENPITVGNGYLMKLVHTSGSKTSSRGQAGYDTDGQPQKGGGEGGQAKRLSGLEVDALLSSGAYAVHREGSTLRGAQNYDYWKTLRSGGTPKMPGAPFAWDKFQALLKGAGYHARETEPGTLRMGPFTDRDLESQKPVIVTSGETVNQTTLEPVKGGLFDETLAGRGQWGKIPLPVPLPNPSMEEPIRKLLGLTEKQFWAVMSGEEELPYS